MDILTDFTQKARATKMKGYEGIHGFPAGENGTSSEKAPSVPWLADKRKPWNSLQNGVASCQAEPPRKHCIAENLHFLISS